MYMGKDDFIAMLAAFVIIVSPIPRAIFATEFDDAGAMSMKSYLPTCTSPARKGAFEFISA